MRHDFPPESSICGFDAALTALCLIIFSPFPQGVHHGFQAVPELGQRVFHARRHLGVDLARQQTALLHLAQLCGQNLLRDMPDGLFQFAETQGAVHQVTQDEHLPFIADESEGSLHGAGWEIGSCGLGC